MKSNKTESFYTQFVTMLETVIPGYKDEGKTSLTIAIGCTGGQHRSVALSERIGKALKKIIRCEFHTEILQKERRL